MWPGQLGKWGPSLSPAPTMQVLVATWLCMTPRNSLAFSALGRRWRSHCQRSSFSGTSPWVRSAGSSLSFHSGPLSCRWLSF